MDQFRVLVLADESNLSGAARALRRRPDWALVRRLLADPDAGRQLVEMVMYVGLPPNLPEYQRWRESKQRFVWWLETNGFLVVKKDGSPADQTERTYKANVDVLMAIDAVQLAVDIKPDIVVLVTGDADFSHLAMQLRRRGIRVEVAATSHTLSAQLRASANAVIDLSEAMTELPPLRGGDAVEDIADTIVS